MIEGALDPTLRDRRALILGGATAVALVAAIALSLRGASEVAAPPPPTVALPAPMPALPLQPTLAAAPPQVDGLTLYGVGGGGPGGRAALLGSAGRGQRAVPVGRDYLPGLRVSEVGLSWAILRGAGGDVRLDLDRAGAAQVSSAAASTPAPAPAAGFDPGRIRRDITALRLGTQARRSGGAVTGYIVRPGARLPMLEGAGLRPGDVLVAVNGQALDGEERLFGIPAEMAGAPVAEIEFERGGRRHKAQVKVSGQ